MSQHHSDPGPGIRRSRTVRLVMLAVLVPLAVGTVWGLIALWPDDPSSHIRGEVSAYTTKNTEVLSAGILSIEEMSCDGMPGTSDPGIVDPNAPPVDQGDCGNVQAILTDGANKGDEIQVVLTASDMDADPEPGDEIRVYRYSDPGSPDPEAVYQFAEFDRGTPLLVLTIVFALAVIVVVRWRGFASLIGLGFAAFVLVKFMFPALVSGSDPLLVGLVGSSAIMFVVLYTSHGFSVRTTTALIGTLFGLVCTALIGWFVNDWAMLTGVAGEDDFLLAAATPDMTLTSVVLCGIIVAGLGVLNDVTITQASAVWELADTGNDGEGNTKLFAKAMRIGRDHIASSVYTIAFATAGAGLGSLLLITIIDRPLLDVVQNEALSQEIVRTLVGAIGLVLAMPLTTAVGVAAVRATGAVQTSRSSRRDSEPKHPKDSEEDRDGDDWVTTREWLNPSR